MVEFEKEPDYTGMATDVLKLSQVERKIIFDYKVALLLYSVLVMDHPEYYGREIDPLKAREFANLRFPNDLELINKVWEKSIEMEALNLSKSRQNSRVK